MIESERARMGNKGRGILLSLLLAGLLLLSSCAGLPQEPVSEQSLELAASLPLDPGLTLGRLENGLTYYVRHNPEPDNRAELRLVVDAGSVLEREDQQGLAHYLEHMAFNGTEHFQKQEIVDFLESIGMRFGPEVNAYTSFDETVYRLTVPTEDPEVLEKAVQVLEDWAHRITLDPKEVEKERGIIIEEWRLGRGAEARMWDKQLPRLYAGSRYAERLPIGKLEVIRAADAEHLRQFYRDWYRPELMAVIAVGDFDAKWMEQVIRRKFSRLEPRPDAPKRRYYPVPDHEQTLYAPATDPEATEARVNLFIKHEVEPFETVADYRSRIVEYIYHGILNERLDELAQQAEPPFLLGYSGTRRSVRTSNLYILGARVEEERLLEGLEALLIETERVRRHGFTEAELERQKERIESWIENAYVERENTESESLVGEYLRHYLQGDPTPGIEYEYRLFKKHLPGIGLEEVNRQARKWLTEKNRVILLNAPEKEGAEIPDKEEVLALFRQVETRQIGPYSEKDLAQPLIPEEPRGGRIRFRRQIAGLGLTELELENGVRVVLKPTDFKKDEVLFTAYSPGGHSLASDEQYVAALTAASVIMESGFGAFNKTELAKKLAGERVEVEPWIGQLHEGIRGKARLEDLDTLFKLIYLTFTAPRLDQSAFAAYRKRRAAELENRLASPEAHFWDTVQRIITQNHFRARPWKPEMLEEMDLEASYEFYRDRFAEAGDFTFFFVGSFTPERIEPLVETYLGSLPSRGREESWRDIGIDPPRGVIERSVYKGLEAKSRVQFVFSGPFDWSLESNLRLQALAEILDIRLREVLREELGGTYSIGASASSYHFPDEEYYLYIGFGCAPEQAGELSNRILEQVGALRQEGPGEEVVEKVKGIFLREHETRRRENSFWLQTLQSYYANGIDPSRLLDYEERVGALSAEEIRQAARLYLDTERYVRVTLYPEDQPQE